MTEDFMKKSPLNFARFFTLLCSLFFIFGLFSCSSFLSSNDENGSVSFVIDRSILNAARDGSGIHDENVSYLVVVNLEDNKGFGVKQTVNITAKDFDDCMKTDRRFEANFKKVPVGKEIYAIVKIYQIFGKDTDIPESDLPEPEMIGKSDPIKVKSGKNEITIHAYNYRYSFDFSITISIEGLSENQFSQIQQNLLISAIPSDSQDAKRIAAAGTDQAKIYEALYNLFDTEDQMAFSYGSQFTFDPQLKTITVKGNMYLPVSLDSASTKGSEVVLIAGIYDLDRYSGNSKTKLFGQSAKISPEKKKTNTVSISAKEMEIIDTPLVTYSETDSGYSYAINGFSKFTSTNDSFCFDKDGNVYTISSQDPNNSYANYEIISSNLSSPVVVGQFNYVPSVVVDLKTNIMYAYYKNVYTICLYQYPNLISDGSYSSEKFWSFNCDKSVNVNGLITEVNPCPRLCTVYDGVLYIVAEDSSDNDYGSFIYKTELGEPSADNRIIPDGIHIDLPYGSITDMVYLDGYLYMTGEEVDTNWNTGNTDSYGNDIYKDALTSRGFICKYNPSDNTCSFTGVSTDKRVNTSMNSDIGLALYKKETTYYPVYKNSERTNLFIVAGDLEVRNSPYNSNFPSICTPSPVNKKLSTSALYGASRIIAIKPKKLVISEEGIAFYTENDQLFYKNVNRIVTVNLENFAMQFDTTGDTFDGDKTSLYNRKITADSAFWNAYSYYGPFYPGESATQFAFEGNPISLYLGIPCKEN